MTVNQGLAFAIVVVMMALFIWGRWRYDIVAAVALLASVAAGIVPPEEAFRGFSDDIVIIVGSALVVSAAVARSGIIERIVRKLGPYLRNPISASDCSAGPAMPAAMPILTKTPAPTMEPMPIMVAPKTSTSRCYVSAVQRRAEPSLVSPLGGFLFMLPVATNSRRFRARSCRWQR